MKTHLLLSTAFTVLMAQPLAAQVHKPQPSDTRASQMEHLDRGLVAVRMYSNNRSVKSFLSWRLLGTDDTHTAFTVLRNGKPYGKKTTNMLTATSAAVSGDETDKWQVVTIHDGVPTDTTAAVTTWNDYYLPVHLDRPAAGTVGGKRYSYTPNDCSVGDVDGDGQYEIFVKWDPTNSKDNSSTGLTGPVIIDCYKLDGTRLWRVDLGKNIRAGAHYTQYLVYDFDGDGRAEMICKTAPGSLDGQGHYVNQAATSDEIKAQDNTADYRTQTSDGKKLGHVLAGPEYLTVFNGLTGAAVHTIYYNPNRAGGFNSVGAYPAKSFWGDDYGNRADRFLAAVAWLDGPDGKPSAVMCRGYYTKSYLWAVDFDGKHLLTKWLHASVSKKNVEVYDSTFRKTTYTYNKNTFDVNDSYTAYGQGAHNISAGDVDGDGRDEVIYGSAAVDDNGRLLWSTGLGHGDAQHLGDFDPDREGYEYFMVHEDSPYGFDLRDAATGEKILWKTAGRDTGRGLIADVDDTWRGAEYTYATQTGTYNIQGTRVAGNDGNYNMTMGMNFRLFWDGDAYEELLDGTDITKYSAANGYVNFSVARSNIGSFGNSASCNSTKATPCLTADLFGDWREEVIFWDSSDSATLNVFSSSVATSYRVPTLMHDNVYRLGVARENVGYNQPPHLGYYLPDFIESFRGVDVSTGIENVADAKASVVRADYYDLSGNKIKSSRPVPGVYIGKVTLSDGCVETRKVVVR